MNSVRAILSAVRERLFAWRLFAWRLPATWLEPEDAFWPTLHDYPYTS